MGQHFKSCDSIGNAFLSCRTPNLVQASSLRGRSKPRSRSRSNAAGSAPPGTAQQESPVIQVHLLIRAQINHRAYPALHAAGRVSFAAVVFTSVVCAYPVTQTPDQKAPCGYETWPCPCSLPNGRSHSEMIMLQRKLWDTPESEPAWMISSGTIGFLS